MTVLQQEHGYQVVDWTVVFRRTPERVFKALAKSKLKVDQQFKEALCAEPIDFSQRQIADLIEEQDG
jgi:hypothetical protein